MKKNELTRVMAQFQLESAEDDKYIVRYGEDRSSFFIVIQGELSAWKPIKPEGLLKSLKILMG